MAAQVVTAEFSPLFLPAVAPVRRRMRNPALPRPARFMERFEDRALLYDAFHHHRAGNILLLGPPPLNLRSHWQAARIRARPSGRELSARMHVARSSMIIALAGAPEETTHLDIRFAGQDFSLAVRPDMSGAFAGNRVVFSMNRNNDLAWIRFWALYHARMHGADAVILFDNGSTRYTLEQLEQTLAGVPGMKKVMVCNWPFRFGAKDPGVLMHPYWAHFLQNASFSELVRRLAGQAGALLNMDIDELARPVPGSDIFAMAQNSASGFVTMTGQWVENVAHQMPEEAFDHRRFVWQLRDFRRNLNARKWALDPKRDWLDDLDLQPSWHKIKHMPASLLKRSPVAGYWHFRGINTGWKENRARHAVSRVLHRKSPELVQAFNRCAQEGTDRS